VAPPICVAGRYPQTEALLIVAFRLGSSHLSWKHLALVVLLPSLNPRIFAQPAPIAAMAIATPKPLGAPLELSEKPTSTASVTRSAGDLDDSSTDSQAAAGDVAGKTHYGWQFWAVFAALVAATLLSALDGAIVATALPTISLSLDAGPLFVWIANVYFLTGYDISLSPSMTWGQG